MIDQKRFTASRHSTLFRRSAPFRCEWNRRQAILWAVRNQPELIVIREVLEGSLAPDIAAAVLFSALDRTEGDPSGAGWSSFVQHSLRTVLHERVGNEVGEDIVDRVLGILGRVSAPIPSEPPTESPTGRFVISDGPTRALVIAANKRLARLLKGALGSRIVPAVAVDAPAIRRGATDFLPSLVILDLCNPIDAGLGVVVHALDEIAPDVLIVIWSPQAPIAEKLPGELRKVGRRTMVLPREHGVDPLLDLVRASQG